MVSVATTELCHYSAKTAIDNTQVNGHGYVPIKLYLQKQAVGQIWPESCHLLTLLCVIRWPKHQVR